MKKFCIADTTRVFRFVGLIVLVLVASYVPSFLLSMFAHSFCVSILELYTNMDPYGDISAQAYRCGFFFGQVLAFYFAFKRFKLFRWDCQFVFRLIGEQSLVISGATSAIVFASLAAIMGLYF